MIRSEANAGTTTVGLRTNAAAWARPLPVALIIAALTLPRLIFAGRYDLVGDETYYAIWSFFPGFGYFDHSPGVAWVIWIGRTLFGESEWAVRSLFVLASFAMAALLYRIALLLFEDSRAAAVAAIGYAATPGIAISFTLATPDGPSVLFWVATVWAIAEFLRGRNANWWLLAGSFAGLGLLSKYTLVFLGAGILLYLISGRDRIRWLQLWQVWAGGAIALLMFAPVVWIDSQRDWISFRFQLGRSTLDERVFRPDELVRFLVETGIQLLPTLFVFAALGLGLFLARRGKALALPVLTSLPMLGYFLVHALFGRVNPNWVAPLYPMLALIGAWAVVNVRPAGNWFRWPLNGLKALHVPLGVALMLAALSVAEFRSLPLVGPVPIANFLYGWEELQAKISRLAADNGAKWVDTPDYSMNGSLGYYGRIAGDPLPVFQTSAPRRYAYMPPTDPALLSAPHLVIRHTRGDRLPAYRNTTPLGVVTRDGADGLPAQSFAVYLAR